MLLKLIRNRPQANALCGELIVDNHYFCDTLERADVAIPAGFYPVTLTMSPRFGEVLPLIGNVVGRTGIRVHAGNTIRDTAGCILVGVADMVYPPLNSQEPPLPRLLSSRCTLRKLCNMLLVHYNNRKDSNYEALYIEIIDPDPYPLYDVPCPVEQRVRHIDSVRSGRRYECNGAEPIRKAG